ncbi:MAG: hypothetical protein D8M26_10195 [Ignavibacteriae bacterium]|nr:hypothetical protein [Ignavibacteriota bacterium]MCL4280504.1 hypothetical protein [Ignavibacteriaceae bacterium]NUM62105.1 hypothetical protein [Ignavibacteriaceae bacterium]
MLKRNETEGLQMSENIEYIVNARGERIKAIVPIDFLVKRLKGKKSSSKKLTREKLKKYVGSIKLSTDPLKYQKKIRSEWN